MKYLITRISIASAYLVLGYFSSPSSEQLNNDLSTKALSQETRAHITIPPVHSELAGNPKSFYPREEIKNNK